MAISRYKLEVLFVVLSLIYNVMGLEIINSSSSPNSTSKTEETASLSPFGLQGIRLVTLFKMKENCLSIYSSSISKIMTSFSIFFRFIGARDK